MTESLRSKVGDDFEIRLEANPTTGYVWEFSVQSEPAGGAIALLNMRWDEVKSDIAGARVVQVFLFHSIAAGEVTLIFQYRRSWEKEKEATQKRDYKVIID